MQWPTTTARIVEASIRDDHGADRKFYPHITFTFEYENNTYTSNALFASGVVTYFQSLQAAQTFMAPYAKDNKVFVSICPHDPTQSILIAGIQKRFYAGLILGGYFMWLSINRLGF